jgi:hypothetical protein
MVGMALVALAPFLGKMFGGDRGGAAAAAGATEAATTVGKFEEAQADRDAKFKGEELDSINSQMASNSKAAADIEKSKLLQDDKYAQIDAIKTKHPSKGVNIDLGGLVGDKLPVESQKQLLGFDGMIELANKEILPRLEKLPSDGLIDRGLFIAGKQLSATEAGRLNSNITLYKRMAQKAIEGARGSDQDNAVFTKIVEGNFADPKEMGQLIRQANRSFARINLQELKGFRELQSKEGVDRKMAAYEQMAQEPEAEVVQVPTVKPQRGQFKSLADYNTAMKQYIAGLRGE